LWEEEDATDRYVVVEGLVFEGFILEINSSSANPELREYSWLEFVIVDLPDQGGVDTRIVGDSIAYNKEIILTWVSKD
jgi:hypothetical protein